MKSDWEKKLRGFTVHGATFHKRAGNQAVGDCPLCDKENHFYANPETKKWDCKKCQRSGGFSKYLEYIGERNEELLTDDAIEELAEDRGLPKRAFRKAGIGYDGDKYTFTVRDFQGRVVDIRMYRLGKSQVLSTAGIKGVGLWGSEKILRKEGKVYVCEGEWDTVALRWLLRKTNRSGVVVGVPGAGTFKEEWTGYFARRDVVLCYDNDKAGDAGEAQARSRLDGVANSIKYLHWPDEMPSGFDVRDWICRTAVERKKPKTAWRKLKALFLDEPRKTSHTAGEEPSEDSERPISNKALIKKYKKWLKMKDYRIVEILYGAVFANRLEGDPIWLFVVGPPGCGKSEMIMSMSGSKIVYALTSLTQNSLISGAIYHKEGEDPSLLPKLNNKILAIKDFTALNTMHPAARDDIFGQLRDIYDGTASKRYGTGVTKSYKDIHFGIIAGVTPSIEKIASQNAALGARFLKVRMSSEKKSEEDIVRRAMRNINRETRMRRQLASAAARALRRPMPSRVPEIPEDIETKLIYVAQFAAAMRGVVEKERYSGEVQYKPMTEIATRLAKQLAKLAIGIAIFHKRRRITEVEFEMVKQVAKDTAPDRVEEIIKTIWENCPTKDDTIRTRDLAAKTHFPIATISRVLGNLELLKVVSRYGTAMKHEWTLRKRIRKIIIKGDVYERNED